jgi:hypothetical protein
MSFEFNPDQRWEVSTDIILGPGNHICDIREITAGPDTTSKNGYPEVRLKLANEHGSLRDWITISSTTTFGQFTSLVLAAGFPESEWPQAGTDFDPTNGMIYQAYADKLLGKVVGVVAREEPDYRNPEKTRTRVKGYVPPSEIEGSDATPTGAAGEFVTFGSNPAAPAVAEDDIPFLNDGFQSRDQVREHHSRW